MAQTRTRRPQSEWQRLVAKQRESALLDREFCRREGLSLSTFRWWRSRLRAEGDRRQRLAVVAGRPSFLPVTVRDSRSTMTAAGAIEILILGDERRVRMRADCPVELAVAVAQVLRGAATCS